MIDVLYYELNGYNHKRDVNTLQTELTSSFLAHRNFSLRRLLELLPLDIKSPGRILARGDISWISDGKVTNEYEADQVLEFGDPALGTFFLSVPAKITSKYKIDSAKDSFSFEIQAKGVVLQLNKLVEEGFNRSAFQIIKELHFERNKFYSVLEDQNDPKKITHLVVLLAPEAKVSAIQPSNSLISFATFTEEVEKVNMKYFSALDKNCCDEIFGGDEWYVFYRKGSGNPGICVEHKGTTIEGGEVAWERVGGPFDSEQEAKNFTNTCSRCM